MLACLALRATTKTRCLADRRVAPIAIPECRNGSKAFDLRRAVFWHRGLSAVGKAAGHESRLRGPRKRPYGLHERKPQHWRSEAFGFRVPRRWLSCRGHLAQTEGRAGAETAGEGRPSRAIPIKPTEPPCDLQATSSTRRLKRRSRASDAPRFVVARQRMHLYDNICVMRKCWRFAVSLHKSLVAPICAGARSGLMDFDIIAPP